jgi:hypothetical protein
MEHIMDPKNRRQHVMFIFAVVVVMLACNAPVNEPPTPLSIKPSDAPTTQAPAVVTTNPPTQVTPFTSTSAPRVMPTTTLTPLPPITFTSLPPLPDFEDVLTFGGGGGCGRCGIGYCYAKQNPAVRPSVFGISINEEGDPSERTGFLCLYGITQELPFSVRLVSPDGRTVLSNDFMYHAGGLSWDGNFTSIDPKGWDQTGDGLINAQLSILWPVGAPIGNWQIYSEGAGLQAKGNLDATRLTGDEVNRLQEVGVFDPLSQSRILPATHQFFPKADTGGLDVIGDGFTLNSLVYILIYQKTDKTGDGYGIVWDLINKMSAVADNRGFISTEIPGPFYAGQTYMVVSVSDPARLQTATGSWTFNFNDDSIGYQSFQIAASPSQSGSSCPGAPQQRMTVNQRGFVCTKSDPVLLRNKPNRSGTQIVSLDPGVAFTVIGGPSCANNWSWWQVQLDNGVTGWVSEGGDEVDPYFICPLK